MDNRRFEELNKEIAKSVFKGKKEIVSKLAPRYPESAERELRRVTSLYVKIINEELKKELGPLMKKYRLNLRSDIRIDDAQDFYREVRRAIQRIAERIEQRIAVFDIAAMLSKAAEIGKKYVVKEWKRIVRGALGINLFEDYYKGDFFREMIQTWIAENVSYIQSIPATMLDDMRQIILEGFNQGKLVGTVQRDLQDRYNISKHKAQMLARDQMSTLNAQISEAQQRDAGVTKYRWSSSKDSRVRDCHRELDGKIFSWDDPPEMWYNTKSRGRVYTGRFCHPGQDYCCRCVAIPVFEIERLEIPVVRGTNENYQ